MSFAAFSWDIYATIDAGPPSVAAFWSLYSSTNLPEFLFLWAETEGSSLKEISQRFGSVMFLISVLGKDEQPDLHEVHWLEECFVGKSCMLSQHLCSCNHSFVRRRRVENKEKHALNDGSVADSKINEPTNQSLEWHSLLIRSPRRSDHTAAIYINQSFRYQLMKGPVKWHHPTLF